MKINYNFFPLNLFRIILTSLRTIWSIIGTQPNLNTGIMNNFKIPLPPIELQNIFVEILFQITKQKRLTQQSLQKSEDLFQSLLQRAFKEDLFL